MMKVTRRGRPDSAQSTAMAHSMYPTCHCYSHTPHWAGMAVDDVVQVVPLLGHFLKRTTVGKHDSQCAAHRIRRRVRPHTRRSFPDASQHGRVLSARRLGFCSFPECRGCADKRAPQRRVEVRGRGDHDAPFVGPHGCPTVLLLSDKRRAADADAVAPIRHPTIHLRPAARRSAICCLARTSGNAASSQCCHEE